MSKENQKTETPATAKALPSSSGSTAWRYTGQTLATFASAGICAYWAHLTGGASGIGWFVFSLILIW